LHTVVCYCRIVIRNLFKKYWNYSFNMEESWDLWILNPVTLVTVLVIVHKYYKSFLLLLMWSVTMFFCRTYLCVWVDIMFVNVSVIPNLKLYLMEILALADLKAVILSWYPVCTQILFIPGIVKNTWKVLKCGVGEGWRRSVGPIMLEMKKCYLEWVSRGISYMK
jgi:hypothetical protein